MDASNAASSSEEFVELVKFANSKGWSVGGGHNVKTGEMHVALQPLVWSLNIPSNSEVVSVLGSDFGDTDIVEVDDVTTITFDGKLNPGFRMLVERLIEIEHTQTID